MVKLWRRWERYFFKTDVGFCWTHRAFWRYACRDCQRVRYQ